LLLLQHGLQAGRGGAGQNGRQRQRDQQFDQRKAGGGAPQRQQRTPCPLASRRPALVNISFPHSLSS
jgi:hypothetical protein